MPQPMPNSENGVGAGNNSLAQVLVPILRSGRQGGIEAALIQKHQASWCGEQRGEIVQELCAPFLIPFAGDQRFFYA